MFLKTVYDELVTEVNGINAIDTSKQVKKTDLTQKLKKLKKIPDHDKYITTSESNESYGELFYQKLKRAKLGTNKNLNTVSKQATKHEKKIEKLQTFEFLWRWFSKYVCLSTIYTLDLKEVKGTEYIIAWKSKRLHKSRLHPLNAVCWTYSDLDTK